jgi:hypothetical protein
MNRFFDDYYGDAFEMMEFMTRKQRDDLIKGKANISHLIPGDEFFSSKGYNDYVSESVAPITKEHIDNYYK